MFTKTTEILPGVCVTSRTEDGRAMLTKNIVYRKLKAYTTDDVNIEFVIQFVAAYTQSTISGDLGFVWPSPADEPEVFEAAFENWLALPARALRLWFDGINAVDMPPGDPELFPAPLVAEEKKETSA